ncbi:MAG: DUF4143 domain-containing protein [FCB group bacterium]|nr:DUF4143 domain-containing protein [FCB group bacterium]
MSLHSLSKESNLDMRTLKRYLTILQDTFIIDLLPPLYSNKRKELKKMPKIFLKDTGIRNALIDNFIPFENRTDKGELLETQCFSALKRDDFSQQQMYYWRTLDGKEVDFVLFEGGQYIPFEVKTRKSSIKHLKYFRQLYPCSESNLIQLETDGNSEDTINVIRPWYL